jgi:hypothetical protein
MAIGAKRLIPRCMGARKSSSGAFSLLVCSKPFQDELRITFTHGDAITITGAKVKQEESEVILARELVKGGRAPSLSLTTSGNPVRDSRIGSKRT